MSKVICNNNRVFEQSFTLCYKTEHYSNLWKCENGFDSIVAADTRVNEIRKQHEESHITIFPYRNFTPNAMRRLQIQCHLTPKVIIVKNK